MLNSPIYTEASANMKSLKRPMKRPFKRKLQVIRGKKTVRYQQWIPCKEDILKLNVAGRLFVTSRSTLCKYPDSVLAEFFSRQHTLDRDEKGAYFIDRNPEIFQHILTWLRYGSLPTLDAKIQRLVDKELAFWNLDQEREESPKKIEEATPSLTKESKSVGSVQDTMEIVNAIVEPSGPTETFENIVLSDAIIDNSSTPSPQCILLIEIILEILLQHCSRLSQILFQLLTFQHNQLV
jgi:hypothetical protein